MRGRKATPPELKQLAGNPGKRPLPAPVNVLGRPQTTDETTGKLLPAIISCPPPPCLGAPGAELWLDVVPGLLEARVIDLVDLPGLTTMCQNWEISQVMWAVLTEGYWFARGSTGQMTKHPAFEMFTTATTTFIRIAEQYALTPAARARLGLAVQQGRSLKAQMYEQLGPHPTYDIEGEAKEIKPKRRSPAKRTPKQVSA